MATPQKKKTTKKSNYKNLKFGRAYVLASMNNTIVTITDKDGSVVGWASAGSCGFKGSRKSTPYAAQVAAEKAAETATSVGIDEIDVFVKGLGNGREQAIRGLIGGGLELNKIVDITPVPHNGCRKKRPRRV